MKKKRTDSKYERNIPVNNQNLKLKETNFTPLIKANNQSTTTAATMMDDNGSDIFVFQRRTLPFLKKWIDGTAVVENDWCCRWEAIC